MRDVTVQVAGNLGEAAAAVKPEPRRQQLDRQLESFGKANVGLKLLFILTIVPIPIPLVSV